MGTGQGVAIFTSKVDPHADAVISRLRENQVTIFRLNTEDLLNRYELSISLSSQSEIRATIVDEVGRSICLPRDISTIYHRKPDPVKPNHGLRDEGARAFASREGDEVIHSLASLPDVRWVNNPYRIRAGQHKLPQLEVARRLGLKVPRSLVTRDPDDALQFCESCGWSVICKGLGTTSVTLDGEPRNLYTYAPSRSEIEAHIDSVRLGLTFFQEYVPKAFELRITVIGERVFPCRIESQRVEDAMIDWRLVDPFTLDHYEYPLPKKVSDALIAFLQQYGLCFGAIDMIVTPDEEYVFVENNPNGQWYWIEQLTGMPMANAMASLLTGG
jgi:glutathione synthase/RimK-type ligase-like ATP-grasp enzyme